MEQLLTLALFLPLVSFMILLFSPLQFGRKLVSVVAPGVILISFILFLSILFSFETNGLEVLEVTYYKWIATSDFSADFALHLDHLSLLMALIITGVGFLIHVFSIGYMDHEKDYSRYFAELNFFVFAMLLLVLAKNLLLLFVGWEGVGLASYLLIGFWYEKKSAADAATKAFVMNRIGDVGLLLGIIFAFYLFGTTDTYQIQELAGQKFSINDPSITILTLLLFVGAIGKSAQLPLLTWLPDAMEGPTPVSALIHAATMVTAGVYLLVRLDNLFLLSPTTLQVVGLIGGVTALYAAIVAIGQSDLKRVLAYSTVSQLGLMFLACGAGAFYSAMFHLTTHAFIKALLFLSAGNVIHMTGGNTEMGQMGGLLKSIPKTAILFFIGVLALSGIPPFAAFFSKDLILELEYVSGHTFLFVIGVIVSLLTGFYLMRAFCLTFLGEKNSSNEPHEAPYVMLLPCSILALLSVFGGYLGFSFGGVPFLERFLEKIGITNHEEILASHMSFSFELVLAITASIAGFLFAYFVFAKYNIPMPEFLKKGFYLNEIYDFLFTKPLKAISRFMNGFFELNVIQGSIHLVEGGTSSLISFFQLMQNGLIRTYVAWMVIGACIVSGYLLIFLRHYE